MYCSRAIYEPYPYHFLSNNSTNHNIKEVLFCGQYHDPQDSTKFTRILMALDGSTLYVASKGSDSPNDWATNVDFGMEEYSEWNGKVHGGFLKKAGFVNTIDIVEWVMVNDLEMVITTGHSMGGAVSSLLHLKLNRFYQDCAEKTKKPELVNVTFGSPMFGNIVMAEDVEGKNYASDMYHFASTSDVVPSLLSIGHTFKVFKDNLGFIGQYAMDWLKDNRIHFDAFEKTLMCLNNATIQGNPGQKNTLNTFIQSYNQITKSLEASSLLNTFKDFDYAPMGNYLLLQKQQNGSHNAVKMNDKKLVETILQRAVEYQMQDWSTLVSDHLMISYLHKIKEFLGGLQTFRYKSEVLNFKMTSFFIFSFFSVRKIKSYSADVSFINGSHNFIVEPVSRYFCGYDNCNQCQKITFYEQDDSLIKNIIFCRTCEKDPHILEHYFHEICSQEFHVGDKADHEMTTFDFSKIEQGDRKRFLLQTRYGDINQTRWLVSTVMHTS